MKNIVVSVLVGVILTLLFAHMYDSAVNASTFQSPLQTPTAQPDPDPDPGDGDGGTVDFPDIEFDMTIMAVIAGLVQMSKQLGVKGNGSLVVSMVLGLALGGSSVLAAGGTPSDFAGWFGVLIIGLAYGLSTSGLYLLAKTYRPGMGS